MSQSQDPVPVTEPSIWDHFIEKLKFWSRSSGDDVNVPQDEELTPDKGQAFPLVIRIRAGFSTDRSTHS